MKSKIIALAVCAGFTLAVNAGEAEIRKAMEERFPEAKIDKISRGNYGGLYELLVNDQIVYADEKGTFVIQGTLVDLKTGKNVTAERRTELTKINFDELPLNLAMKTVKGNGKRKLAIFSDPDCPFCRRLENDLKKVSDVTIYTFLYPIESLHPQAVERSKAIWCSKDKVKAWDDYMLNNVAPQPPAANCDAPIAKIAELGQKYKINGTPTLFFANGRKVPGAIPPDQLESLLTAK